jgi:hypothetical protein
VTTSLEYLEKRQDQIRYAEFAAAGYPIGSGAVESANKLVVEARLKGSGMHWARPHVTPLVALRALVCSDRWETDWPALVAELRRQPTVRRAQRRAARRALAAPPVLAEPPRPLPAVAPADPVTGESAAPPHPTTPPRPAPTAGRWRPAADHPWRKRLLPERRAVTAARTPDAEI